MFICQKKNQKVDYLSKATSKIQKIRYFLVTKNMEHSIVPINFLAVRPNFLQLEFIRVY
jgi:hypothetical protein